MLGVKSHLIIMRTSTGVIADSGNDLYLIILYYIERITLNFKRCGVSIKMRSVKFTFILHTLLTFRLALSKYFRPASLKFRNYFESFKKTIDLPFYNWPIEYILFFRHW